MKYNIRCDLEGLTGITRFDQVRLTERDYQQGRNALLHDLTAVITGIETADPQARIIIYDEHERGSNIDPVQLPAKVSYIAGKPSYSSTDGGFLTGCAGMFLVGFHAKAGTTGGLLPHTYEEDILELQINGVGLGEVGLEAAIAGEYNVPTVFFSGDSSGAAEFQELIPDGVAIVVKEALTNQAALCHSGKSTWKWLVSGAAAAVRRCQTISPFTVPMLSAPVELGIRLRDSRYRDCLKKIRPAIFSAAEWIIFRGDALKTVYAQYIECKNAAATLRDSLGC
jgi:D-amino peptidase